MNEYVKVSVGVDNLFDKAYSEHLNLAGNGGFGYSANTLLMNRVELFGSKLT